MSGLLRQRIGPAKTKIITLIAEATPLLAKNTTDMNQQEKKNLLSTLAIHIAKMEKQVDLLETKDGEWGKLIESMQKDKLEAETELYHTIAGSPDGYLEMIDSGTDCLIELRQKKADVSDAVVDQTLPAQNESTASVLQPQNWMKLKEGHLPSFSGDTLKWPEFWDSYRSAVHENPNLPAAQKFVYLKGVLSGKAADTVAGFPLTDTNYDEAVTLLQKRFGDENGQRATLRQNLMDLPKVTGKLEELEHLHYTAVTIQRRLRVLGDDLSHNSLAIQQIQSKIPYTVMIDLEKEKNSEHDWTVTSLMEGLDKYLQIRKRIQHTHPMVKNSTEYVSEKKSGFTKQFVQREHSYKPLASAETLIASKPAAKFPCQFCGNTHFPDDCTRLKTDSERRNKLAAEQRCFLCLKNGHRIANCPKKANQTCYYCKKIGSHHRSICPVKFGNSAKKSSSSYSADSSKSENVARENVQFSTSKNGSALLAEGQFALLLTASVTVRCPKSAKFLQCRLLLDCGSQRSYLVNSVADSLDLPLIGNQELLISTFAAEQPQTMHTSVTEIEIFCKDGSSKKITANVIPTLTGELKREQLCPEDLQVLKTDYSTALADVLPDKEEVFKPSILIGMDYYFEFCSFSQNYLLPSGLQLVPSKFGLLIGGRTSNFTEDNLRPIMSPKKGNVLLCPEGQNFLNEMKHSDPMLKFDIRDFWSLESIGIQDSCEKNEDDTILSEFEKTVIFEDNRYHVRWPWKEPEPELPKNYGLALGRLCSLSKRLSMDQELLQKYTEIIDDQGKKGITENITGLSDTSKLVHYLPHHPVMTLQKATTKVRIVYDASAKASQKMNSLNDCVHTGPNLIPDLCGMLLRFRLPKTAIVSDVEKAFLQVGLQMPDRDVTRFFWFKDPSDPWIGPNSENLAVHRFRRIPFGVASSPFLLEAVIKHHLHTMCTPLAKEMEQNLYVDNILVTADKTEAAFAKYLEGKKIFQDASMNLREWASNDEEFVNMLPEKDRAAGEKLKILGVSWNLKKDEIFVVVPEKVQDTQNLTKRKLLAMISSIFDPLGLWTPATFYGKILFQELWKQGFSWDVRLPDDIHKQWSSAVRSLEGIGNCPLPRWISDTSVTDYSLVAFTDASTKSYGAVVYLLVKTPHSRKSNLLLSKMRLKPVKANKKNQNDDMSIPRLELMGVVVGVRMLNFVKQQLNLPCHSSVLMSDSQCVLQWITSGKTLPLFVRNRISEIKRTSDIKFSHVPTDQNPADFLTKGMSANELATSKIWFHGPDWLVKPEIEWPSRLVQQKQTELVESESVSVALPTLEKVTAHLSPCGIDCSRFSSLGKLLRVTVYCLRFIKNKCFKSTKMIKCLKMIEVKGGITGPELCGAKKLWCFILQRQEFSELFQRSPDQKSKDLMKQLGLFVDSEGLIRCGGRFKRDYEESDSCVPIFLPKQTPFTELIVKEAHERTLHGGTNHTLTQMRKEFWLTQGRTQVKRIIKKCVVCKKSTGGPFKLPDFGPLPKERNQSAPPFKYTGLDYFGPVLVKGDDNPKKHWVCLFNCLVVRAVHLELVVDMSTSEFLAAFRRFAARRGCPAKILSDNAKQFKAADIIISKTLRDIHSDPETCDYFAGLNVTWKFIPELSPWQGGIYERMVGIVKVSLKKALGKRLLFPSQMMTVLCEVESIVNTRPITFVTSELPNHPVLTPNDFLLPSGQQTVLPRFFDKSDEDEDYIPMQDLQTSYHKVKTLWKKQTEFLEHFWKIWYSEYLNILKERCDFKHPSRKVHISRSPEIGEIVLIFEAGLPRGKWKMGQIINLKPSNDSEIRTATVQLPNKVVLTRPVNHLYSLEIFPEPDKEDRIKVNESMPKNEKKLIRPSRKAAEKCKRIVKEMFLP